jgi:hypothetical protein
MRSNALSTTFLEFSACVIGGGILFWWVMGSPVMLLIAAVAVPVILVTYNAMTRSR